jgi:GNAT superfamily N-acetyltransferase
MRVDIRQADRADFETVAGILREAALWLESRGTPMWRDDELRDESIAHEIDAGLFFIAEADAEPAGTIKYQLTDRIFWPEAESDAGAYVHRLAVSRRYAGGEVSNALLKWAVSRAASLGRSWLRLDCEIERDQLRAVYERFGFEHHSNRRVGPYRVARYQLSLSAAGESA